MISIRHERMSHAFDKWHFDGAGVVLHRFTSPDAGDFHDHSMAMNITVLTGGYVEEVVDISNGWAVTLVERLSGTSHRIEAGHVHRIVRLFEDVCLTAAEYGPWEQEPGFWRLGVNGPERRVWNEGWADA